MAHDAVLDEFLIILATACVVVPVFNRLRLSPVLGYLCSGALIGPYGLGIIADFEATAELAHFGVVFLLFAIGLELSFARLKVMRRIVFGLGSAQVLVTGSVLWLTARAVGLDAATALVIAGAGTLSSTAVVLKCLMDAHEMNTRHGRVSFAILLLQDLVVIPLLAVIPALGVAESADPTATLGLALVKAAGAVAVILVLGRFLFQPVLRLVIADRQPELFTGVTLLIVLGVAWMTEQAGLSMALGAFLAGLVIAETEFRHQVEADVEPFRGILLALFFMTVGMAINLPFLVGNLWIVLGLALALMSFKGSVLFGLSRLAGYTPRQSLRVGTSLAQGSEFSFVLIGMASRDGLLPGTLAQLALAVVALTIALTPIMIHFARKLGTVVDRLSQLEPEPLANEAEELRGHILIAGFGRVGQTLARLLESSEVPYVALDLEPRRVQEGRSRQYNVFFGDASRADVLRAAGTERARAAVVTLDHPHASERTVGVLRRTWPNLTIIVRAQDNHNIEALGAAGANLVVPEMVEGSLHLGGTVLRLLGVPSDTINRRLDDFRQEAYAKLHDIIPARPSPPAPTLSAEPGAHLPVPALAPPAPPSPPGLALAPDREP